MGCLQPLLLQLRCITILSRKLGGISPLSNNEDMIDVDSDDEDENDATLDEFMSSHLNSEIDSFWDSHASLMQEALE